MSTVNTDYQAEAGRLAMYAAMLGLPKTRSRCATRSACFSYWALNWASLCAMASSALRTSVKHRATTRRRAH